MASLRRLGIAATLASCVMAQTALAAESKVVWEMKACDETAVTVGDRKDSTATDLLLVIVYRCASATINGLNTAGVGVSEISVLHSDGSSTLLRQVTDSKALHWHLRTLGLRDSFLGTIDHGPGRTRVAFGRTAFALSGPGGTSPAPPTPSEGGATYSYEGPKGTIRIAYDNHEQSIAPSVVTVDASQDPALAAWIGSTSTTAPAVAIRGAWTGTASVTAR